MKYGFNVVGFIKSPVILIISYTPLLPTINSIIPLGELILKGPGDSLKLTPVGIVIVTCAPEEVPINILLFISDNPGGGNVIIQLGALY